MKLFKFSALIIFFFYNTISFSNNIEKRMGEVNNENYTLGIYDINEELKSKMIGNSYIDGATVKITDLALVKVRYINFQGETEVGDIVIHKNLANDIYEIFEELYENKYPIEKIKLVDEYNNSDTLSMKDNNTYAFSIRKITSGKTYSNHAYGKAIDINPIQNPYIKNNIVEPGEGKEYKDRKDIRKGMILKGDICYNAFKKRGWTWGGEWKSLKDYQHFEKK